ncbi:hypothetical protein CF328_g9617, partial [Tilletia controversa]
PPPARQKEVIPPYLAPVRHLVAGICARPRAAPVPRQI